MPRKVVTRLANKLIAIKEREMQQLYGGGKKGKNTQTPRAEKELSESLGAELPVTDI